jgi:N-formylglutamate deformylase
MEFESEAVILHIPHSSKEIPVDIRSSLLLSDTELESEIIRLTDSYTDELFDFMGAIKVVFPVSRLIVDPERFIDDSHEPMFKHGMGVVYTRDTRGRLLRLHLSENERNGLIQKYYEPHHKKLTEAINKAINDYRHCLIIDCHSFPSIPFEYEEKKSSRPNICIGTDKYHTPKWLEELSYKSFMDAGFSVEFNNPFSGTMVPLSYYQINTMVYSVMIEVNRSLYMDEKTGLKNGQFGELKDRIGLVIQNIIKRGWESQ